MAVRIGHASISEKGTIRGAAGDQTGKEVCIKHWTNHAKGWVTLRCKNAAMRAFIAEAMERACPNNDIGYDQPENQTLWNDVKDKGHDPAKTTKKVETDCARLVRLCIQYALDKMGIDYTIPDFYTASLASVLVKSGYFDKLTSDKYNKQDAFLLRGDIQVTRTKGHTWVILDNGSKSGTTNEPPKTYELGERTLRNGDEGADVKELQGLLIQAGYGKHLGEWGADGDFGDATELAVMAFQKEHGCTADGEVGPTTLAAIDKALDTGDGDPVGAHWVEIVGGDCWAREEPNTSGKKLGVAKKGQEYEYLGRQSNGWYYIRFGKANAWVSGKYAKLMEG